ncbi:MAG: hypothetical protein ABEK04_06030 [Candidatus Nanohalobium sp.]
MRDKFLKSMLAGESRAYGFTIGFWGSGVVLINTFGVPGVFRALIYGLGAVTGFGILAINSFGGITKEVEKKDSEYLALGTTHYLASLAPIAIAGVLARYLTAVPAFFVGGLSVSLTYNLLALLEEDLSELLN